MGYTDQFHLFWIFRCKLHQCVCGTLQMKFGQSKDAKQKGNDVFHMRWLHIISQLKLIFKPNLVRS
jgi:hypothetical protein